MKILLAATAALSTLALAPMASAQSQYGPPPGNSAYGDAYDSDDGASGPQGGYDQQQDDSQQGYGQQGYGPDYAQPMTRGPASGNHYPTNGYPRVQPDSNSPSGSGDDGYAGDMPDGADMDSDDYGDNGSAYPTDNGAYTGSQGGYAVNPPAPMTRGPAPGYARGGPAYGPSADIPPDIQSREDRLERQIRHTDRRGDTPEYATDNLMIVLNSIRDQQAELAARDHGLNFTDRRFIEARLNRLEQQVRALR